MQTCTLLLIAFFMMNELFGQDVYPLYPGKIPNSKNASNEEKTEQRNGITVVTKISEPSISYFPADSSTSTNAAVIIFPGGGYGTNSLSHEGYDVARTFNQAGITAFVVKYRLPDDRIMVDKEMGPLQDAQQAIKMVRENAAKYKIDPQLVGIMGFSAGGHLASTAGTHFKKVYVENTNNTNIRPDFMILVYPVISFQDDIGHRGSRDNLLGKNASKTKIDLYSNELRVTPETPPTLLVHASDDDAVVPANSIRFYENLLQHKVASEMHIYQNGGHGFGLNNRTTKDDWFARCLHWMESNKWISLRNK